MLILAFLLESSAGLSFFIGLSSSSKSHASLVLDGTDDPNEDKIGVIGFGCPAGNDVEANALTSSSLLICKEGFLFLTWCLFSTFFRPSLSFRCFNRIFQRGWNLLWFFLLPPSSALAITASASSSLNFTIGCSRGMSVCVCAAGNASALLLA